MKDFSNRVAVVTGGASGIGKALAKAFLGEGMKVAVVAGFQGIGDDGRITTLGRGGSDTTAVAFAASFGAERCDIFTDVDGVYTTDPRICGKARKLDKIAFEEMLELASLGAKVLQTRSVELAMRYNVKLRVLSSFEEHNDEAGTLVQIGLGPRGGHEDLAVFIGPHGSRVDVDVGVDLDCRDPVAA